MHRFSGPSTAEHQCPGTDGGRSPVVEGPEAARGFHLGLDLVLPEAGATQRFPECCD